MECNHYGMKRLLFLAALPALIWSCQNSFKENWEGLRLDFDSITLSAASTSNPLYIYCDTDWTISVTAGAEWLSVDDLSGSGFCLTHLRYSENNGFSRAATVAVSSAGTTKEIAVTQKGKIAVPKLVFEQSSVTVLADRTSASIAFDSNLPDEYVLAIKPELKYPEASPSWVTSATVSKETEPIEDESMPDGMRHFVDLVFPENSDGDVLEVELSLSFSDAAGAVYKSEVLFIHSAEYPYITLPSIDRVGPDGGERSINIQTNLSEDLAGAGVELSYPAGAAFVSNPTVSGSTLLYMVEANDTGVQRSATLTLSCGSVSASMEIVQQSEAVSYDDYIIYNIYDFLYWAGDYEHWKPTDNITLKTDIDLSGQSYVPHDFEGRFDGEGHVISGLEITLSQTAGFFTVLSGTLENVVFGAPGNGDMISCSVPETTSAAGIVGIASGEAVVRNVTSYVDIVCEGGTGATGGAGGLIGVCASAGEISGCRFYGTVSLGGTTAIISSIGGIIGNVTGAPSVKDCANHGICLIPDTVTAKGSPQAMGGIVGYWSSASSEGTLESCFNNGRIVNHAASLSGITENLGGIVGKLGSAIQVASCYTTDASIVESATLATRHWMGGIVGYVTQAAIISGCSNGGQVANTGNSSHGSSENTADIALGGIVGVLSSASTLSSCTNEGSVSSSGTLSCANNPIAIGGITGIANGGASFVSCANRAEISESNVATLATYCAVGGILGQSITKAVSLSDCTNEGALVKSGGGSYANRFRVGGILGQNDIAATSLTRCTNAGSLTLSAVSTSIGYLGGVVGSNASGKSLTLSSCSNEGNILSSAIMATLCCGGLAGSCPSVTWTGGENAGSVTNTGVLSTSLRMAGGIADIGEAASLSNLTNAASGTVTNSSASTTDVRLAGIVASNTSKAANISSCTNQALVSNTTEGTLAVGYIAGIIAYKSGIAGTVSGCKNYGDLSSSVSGTATRLEMGGIAGYVASGGENIESSLSSCAITSSSTDGTVYAGMAFARIMGSTDCTIKSTGVAGSVSGTTITAANWSDTGIFYSAIGSKTTVITNGEAESCYFLQ